MQPATLPQPKTDRRVTILDAAERCFARSGFHQASMNEICLEAGMSPGNLYRYFPSKEAIIAGIAERNRADAAESFAAAAQAEHFFEGMEQLARHHLVDRSEQEIALCTEIMAESRRNPAIAKLFHAIDVDVKGRIRAMLTRAAERGEISNDIDFDGAATMLMVLADGMSWRRAADPSFAAEHLLPMVFQMVRCLLTQTPTTAESAR
jgi:AcrR family transcriptional regulator